jgi:hypothetical protein
MTQDQEQERDEGIEGDCTSMGTRLTATSQTGSTTSCLLSAVHNGSSTQYLMAEETNAPRRRDCTRRLETFPQRPASPQCIS